MPIIYRKAHDGTVYPVYSGADELAAVRHWYLAHARAYGYAPGQMAWLLSGHPLPPSPAMKRQLAARAAGKCCAFDPRTLHVGDRVAAMDLRSLPGRLPGGAALTASQKGGEAVVGTIPASSVQPAGRILGSGAIVRFAPPARPLAEIGLLVVGLAMVVGLAVYAGLRWWLARQEAAGPVQVAAPRGKE